MYHTQKTNLYYTLPLQFSWSSKWVLSDTTTSASSEVVVHVSLQSSFSLSTDTNKTKLIIIMKM